MKKYIRKLSVTACPDVDFVGNEVDRIIIRGLLITTRGKINIENNRFYSTTMSGVLLLDDADNVVLKNNIIVSCLEKLTSKNSDIKKDF